MEESIIDEIQHTPGPWEVDRIDNTSVLSYDGEDNVFHVARANHANGGLLEGDARANARLIAAAPELYEAAKGLIDDTFKVSSDGEVLRTAPSKKLVERLADAVDKAEEPVIN